MTPQDPREALRVAGDEFRAVRASLAQAKNHLVPRIVAALQDGVSQAEVIQLSGYTRESVRRIARKAGIEGHGPGPAPRN